jgi:outer membrane murein-binding lipoprotein Lpp
MADTWLTIEQAAVALGLSVRTVNRHIVAGKLPSRLQDGRREVLVKAPADSASASPFVQPPVSQPRVDDSPFGAVLSPFASDAPSVTGPAIAGHATVTIPPPQSARFDGSGQSCEGMAGSPSDTGRTTIDTETVLALADNANEKAELAVAAYQALARATDVQFQHVRRSARFAWSAVAVMAVGVSAAVGGTTYYLTKSHVKTQYLQEQVQAKAATADTLSAERETLRAELSAAKEQAARADGRASALTDVQTKLEADIKDARANVTDANAREAQARAELESLRTANRTAGPAATDATTRPTDRASDARADNLGG